MPIVISDGGSPIISYNLMMDNGQNGPFISVIGDTLENLQTSLTIADGIIKGRTYRF